MPSHFSRFSRFSSPSGNPVKGVAVSKITLSTGSSRYQNLFSPSVLFSVSVNKVLSEQLAHRMLT